MKRCLRLISLLLLFCLNPCQAEEKTETYHLYMQVRGREFTGIWVMNESSDAGIVGTVINEFGVKAFDFTYNGRKTQLHHVNAFLDKWYITRILKKDLTFIITNMQDRKDHAEKKRQISFLDSGEVVVVNSRYRIQYNFTPMSEYDETDE